MNADIAHFQDRMYSKYSIGVRTSSERHNSAVEKEEETLKYKAADHYCTEK